MPPPFWIVPPPHCTVNGKPSCSVTMPPICQPPSTQSSTPPRFSHRLSRPTGRSHSHDVVQRRRKSNAESPRLETEVVVVRRRQRVAVGRADAAAVVDRLAPRERAEEAEALREAPLQLQIERVIARVPRRAHHLDAAELRERAREVRVGELARLGVVVAHEPAQVDARRAEVGGVEASCCPTARAGRRATTARRRTTARRTARRG